EVVAFHEGDGDAVVIRDAIRRDRADALARGEDAGEIERIGRADDEQRAESALAADLAQPRDGFRQRELLAGHSGDEPAAARLASCFHPPVDAGQLTPGRCIRLSREQAAEDDTV